MVRILVVHFNADTKLNYLRIKPALIRHFFSFLKNDMLNH
jgi:hypothetical protein